MPDGGPINIDCWSDENKIILQFSDTGPGIADAVQGDIFEPFITTKENNKGTGLGLAVCYGIIKAHKGEISVSNLPEGGALFRIELPIRKTND